MQPVAPTITVGDFLRREGSFLLKRRKVEKGAFSFAEPAITISRSQILGRRPAEGKYTQHSVDAGSLTEVVDLTLKDFAKLTTAME